MNLAASAIALLALALVLALGEAVARWRNPRWLGARDDMSYLHVYSPRYGWEPQKNVTLRLGPTTTVNELGTRGRPYAGPPAPGHRRIVLLGDSITFGYGVADDETFAARLETLEPALEVVNLAVQGYGTDQELLKLEDQGFAYRPDAVVLGFCLANDFRDNGADRSINDPAYRKPFFTLEDGRLVLHEDHVRRSALERAGLALTRRSALFSWLQARAHPGGATAEEAAPDTSDAPPAREVTLALLRRMAEETQARGVRLVILIFPNYREFLKPTRRAEAIVADPGLQGATVVDLRPRYEARGFDRDHYDAFALDGYLHLGPRGHEVTAGILRDVLREAGVLPVGGALGPGGQ